RWPTPRPAGHGGATTGRPARFAGRRVRPGRLACLGRPGPPGPPARLGRPLRLGLPAPTTARSPDPAPDCYRPARRPFPSGIAPPYVVILVGCYLMLGRQPGGRLAGLWALSSGFPEGSLTAMVGRVLVAGGRTGV